MTYFQNAFIDLKRIVCEIHLPRVLNHCRFLVISGSSSSREISKQSNCRNYYSYCYFLERRKFRNKLGTRNHNECMSDCFFFEGDAMNYTDYHRGSLKFTWYWKKKKSKPTIFTTIKNYTNCVKTQLPAFTEWSLLDRHYATFFAPIILFSHYRSIFKMRKWRFRGLTKGSEIMLWVIFDARVLCSTVALVRKTELDETKNLAVSIIK